MKQDKCKNNNEIDKMSHETTSLFTEWPTPSDVVGGFGGSPNKVENKQWKIKKEAPKTN